MAIFLMYSKAAQWLSMLSLIPTYMSERYIEAARNSSDEEIRDVDRNLSCI
jgi:hypothetical protein